MSGKLMNSRPNIETQSEPLASGSVRGVRAFGFSVWAGGLVGVLAYLMRFPLAGDIPVAGGVLFSFTFGAFVGLLCAPVIILLLRTRDVTAVKPFALWMTAAVVCGAAWILSKDEIGTLMKLAGGVFVGSAFLARLVFPRIWDEPGRCRFCGYDIRASVEFGRCPECGHRFDETSWFEKCDCEAPKRPAIVAAAARIVRLPSLPLMIVVLARLIPLASFEICRGIRCSRILPAIEKTAINLQPFDARACTSFAWDNLCIFGPYSSGDEIEKTLGFSWAMAERAAPGLHDDFSVLVFVRGKSVVAYCEIPRRWDFDQSVLGRPIARDEAVFVFQAKDPGGYVLRLRDGAGE